MNCWSREYGGPETCVTRRTGIEESKKFGQSPVDLKPKEFTRQMHDGNEQKFMGEYRH